MKNYKKYYFVCWGFILIILIAFLVGNKLGAKEMKINRVHVNLPNQHRYYLYKINDSMAFEIPEDKSYVSIIGYEKTTGLYALAGEYRHNNDTIFMPTTEYKLGDYLYTRYPTSKTTIVNIKTGEAFGKQAEDISIDNNIPQKYEELGLKFEDKYAIAQNEVIKNFQELNTYDENIFIIVMAFALVFAIMALAGIPIVVNKIKGNVE